jgi:hypothetical protein
MEKWNEIPSMRPVRADDVIPEKYDWESPRRMLPKLAVAIGTAVAIVIAISFFDVPVVVLVGVFVACLTVSYTVDIVRWGRKVRVAEARKQQDPGGR